MSASTVMSVQQTLASANDLLAYHTSLLERTRTSQINRLRSLRALPSASSTQVQALLKAPLIVPAARSPSRSPSPVSLTADTSVTKPRSHRSDLPPAKRARWERYKNYVPEEETIRNDYSQRYVDGGEWPQNWVLGADPDHRFEEYPKQQRLLTLKKQAVQSVALSPTYLPFSQLSTLSPAKFDVILIDPPFSSSFTWETLQDLPIPALASDPSFVLMWVGSGAGDGLERGREVMAKWGFRRCEDIVWIKTNKQANMGPGTDPPTTSLLTRTKQHCLMGIRGTVRRSTDSWFVHCNVDTDVMIYEPDPSDPTLKPPETYTLIENFCLGLRRLEIFGRARTLRRGWVTALAEGEEESLLAQSQGDALGQDEVMDDETNKPVRWNRESWEAKVRELVPPGTAKLVVPMSSEIDALRPKSPVRGGTNNLQNTGNTSSNIGVGGVLPQLAGTPQHLSTMAVPMATQVMNTHSPRHMAGGLGTGNSNFTRPNRDSNSNRMMGPPRMVNMGSMGMPNTAGVGGMVGGGMGIGNMNMGMGLPAGMSGMSMLPWQDLSGLSAGMNPGGGMGGLTVGNMGNQPNHLMGVNMGGMGGSAPRFNQNLGLSGGVSLGTTSMNVGSANTGGYGVGQQSPQFGGMGGWSDGQFVGSGMMANNGAWDGNDGMLGIGSMMGASGMDMNGLGTGMGMNGTSGVMGGLGMGGIDMNMNQWG